MSEVARIAVQLDEYREEHNVELWSLVKGATDHARVLQQPGGQKLAALI